MSLTPEERERIYQEEKTRREMQARLEAEEQGFLVGQPSTPSRSFRMDPVSARSSVVGGIIFVIAFLVILGVHFWQPPTSESTPQSTTPALPLVSNDTQDATLITVKPGWTWTADSGYDYLRGSVVNGSARTVKYWQATVSYFDGTGKIVDTGYTNSIETLLPGAEKRFEVMHTQMPEEVKANVTVEEVRFAE